MFGHDRFDGGGDCSTIFISLMITIVREEITTTSCVLQTFTQFIKSVLFQTSLVHHGLISGERYLSMKHPYEFNNGLVTSARFITCSALAWLFSLILHIPIIIDLAVFSIFRPYCFLPNLALPRSSTGDTKGNFQLSKLRKRQGRNFRKTKGL